MLVKVNQYGNVVSMGLRVEYDLYVSVCDAHCNPIPVEDPVPFLIPIAKDIYVDANLNFYLEYCIGDVYWTSTNQLISLGKMRFDLYQGRVVRIEDYVNAWPVARDNYGRIASFGFGHDHDVVYRPDGKVSNVGFASIRYRADGKIESVCGREYRYYNGKVESIGNSTIRRDYLGNINTVGSSAITRNIYGAPTKIGFATIDYTNGKVSRLDSWRLHLDQYGDLCKIQY